MVVRHHVGTGSQVVTDADEPEAAPLCSAKGCTQTATVALLWNNPKLHTADRRKTWLACDAHTRSLGDFLDARGFLRETAAVDEA